MSTEGSVTFWLGQAQVGNHQAVEHLWNRYFSRLVGLARQKLRAGPRRAADEEDVALSAFDSFCRRVEAGHLPDLSDRDSLWRLLAVITARKALHLLRDEGRQKRGGGAVVRAEGDEPADAPPLLEQILSREPSPDLAAEVAEECQRLLRLLNDRDLEQIACWRMEGLTVDEIAEKLGYSPRSIKRKLQLIRELWEREVGRE
jgi:DNA-directed RNA polymerase specialized sigma24 family protein